MKKVSLRAFQLKPTKYLEDLPIELTRYGKTIAVIYIGTEKGGRGFQKLYHKGKEVKVKKPKQDFKTCKHGSKIGLCKYGCKK